jgi:hypothetical protein
MSGYYFSARNSALWQAELVDLRNRERTYEKKNVAGMGANGGGGDGGGAGGCAGDGFVAGGGG